MEEDFDLFTHQLGPNDRAGFDAAELESVYLIREQITYLMDKNRSSSTFILLHRKAALEAALNSHLMMLDDHTARTKQESRGLNKLTLSISAHLSDSALAARQIRREYEEKLRTLQKSDADKLKSEKKMQEEKLKSLKQMLADKRAKCQDMENAASIQKEKSRVLEQKQKAYKQYKEWISLTQEQEELEATIHKYEEQRASRTRQPFRPSDLNIRSDLRRTKDNSRIRFD